MKKFGLFVLVLVITALLSGFWYVSRFGGDRDLPSADMSTARDTAHGPVIGYRNEGVNVWQGIPFASPPTGELRWKRLLQASS